MSELRVQGLQGLKYHADAGLPTGRTCGLGPTVFVGDTRILTQITGHIGDLISGAPMRMEGCAKGAAGADVSAGAQTVRVKNVGGFEVRDLILTPAFPTVTEPVEGSATVRAWGGVDRDVAVDVDEDALLAVTQSTNPGWVATVDGNRLAPVEIDGWMQGWRLPAGTTGVVRLHFAPQTPYLVGLFGGLLLAAGVVLLAAVTLLRRRRWRDRPMLAEVPSEPRAAYAVGLLVLLAVISVPALVGGLAALAARRRAGWTLAAVGLMLVVAIVLGAIGLQQSLAAPEAANVLAALGVGAVVVTALAPREEQEAAGG